jgi:hypothetical protein
MWCNVPVIPAYVGSINRRITVQVTQGIYAKPIQKITKEK